MKRMEAYPETETVQRPLLSMMRIAGIDRHRNAGIIRVYTQWGMVGVAAQGGCRVQGTGYGAGRDVGVLDVGVLDVGVLGM